MTINRTGTTTLSCTDVGNGATTYEWTLPSGLTGSSTTNTITVTGATAGTYNANNISVKATNDCGYATATGSGGAITVRDCTAAPATPTLTVTATTIDQGGTFQLSCTDVSNGATTYAWTLPSGLTGSSTTNTITVTGATAGTYNANTISVKATNDCGYTTATGSGGAITVRDCIVAPATPTLTVTATTIDQGNTFQLECTDVSDGATTYSWTLPTGLTGSSTTNTITVTGSTAGMYDASTIKVTATNACGSSTTATGSGGAITVNLVCPSSVTDAQGNEYYVGKFGAAGCWMTQNLRSTTGLTENGAPDNVTSNKYYWYPNSKSDVIATTADDILDAHPEYGLLYTWAAASGRTSSASEGNTDHANHRGICPSGWHLPSDYEWNQLEEEIAKSGANVYSTTGATTWESGYSTTNGSYRGQHGQKMRSTTPVNDQTTNGTSNSLTANGFDALLVGRMSNGFSYDYGTEAYFWSSSSYDSTRAWQRILRYNSTGVYRYYDHYKYSMYSVRCKKN
jgi:uncharacterized protein (TIGR02145 family)